MKTLLSAKTLIAAIAAFASVLTVQAGNAWLYDNSAKTLTEQVTDGSTPWVIGGISIMSGTALAANAASGTYATLTTTGDSTELDFTTITNASGTAFTLARLGAHILRLRQTITKIIAPELTEVSNYGCHTCTALVDIVAPGLVKVGGFTFNGCSSLSFPSRWDAERQCTDLDNITIIGKEAFRNAALADKVSFKGYTMESSVNGVFQGCAAITEIELKPEGEHNFGANTFSGCSSLTNVYPLTHVLSLNGNMFNGCSALAKLELGRDGGTGLSIPDSLCDGRTGLKELTLGGNITDIGVKAFRDCSNLDFLKWGDTKPTSFGTDCFKTVGNSSTTILRQYFPALNATWVAEIEADSNYTRWKDLDDTTKAMYMDAYPDGERPDGYCSDSASNDSYLRKGFVFFYGRPQSFGTTLFVE